MILKKSAYYLIPFIAISLSFVLSESIVFAENDDSLSLSEIAFQIEKNGKFENFPNYLLDAISAGEIDVYAVNFVVTKAPEDTDKQGSPSNVARLKKALVDNHDINVSYTTSGGIRLTVPIQELPKIAQYDFVDRVVGKDFGFKELSENGEKAILKVIPDSRLDIDNRIYDLPYSITNGKLKAFAPLIFNVIPEQDGILEISVPKELFDSIDNSQYFANLTTRGIVQDGSYEIKRIEDFVNILWNFPDVPNTSSLQLYGDQIPSDGESVIIENPSVIPNWIHNNALWWSSDQIGDSDFISGIQFLISQKIIKIPPTVSTGNSETSEIPSWIKNNAEWWANGLISDDDFVQGIQYLVEQRIIRV